MIAGPFVPAVRRVMDTPRRTAAAERAAADAATPPAPPRQAQPCASCHPGRESIPRTSRIPALYINRELSWLEFNERVLRRRATPRIRCSSA